MTIDPKGNDGHYFDRAFSRWLPVGRQAVSPDGTHYAFTDLGQQDQFVIHIVEVASGQDHAVPIAASASGILSYCAAYRPEASRVIAPRSLRKLNSIISARPCASAVPKRTVRKIPARYDA